MHPLALATLLVALLGRPCSGAFWGVQAGFADLPEVQSRDEAPVLAQRGVNAVFLDMHGTRFNWPNWGKVEQAFSSVGISCLWDLPTTLGECERIMGFPPETFATDDRPTLMDGSRAYYGPDGRLGNFFLPEFVFQTQRLAKAMARRLKTPVGYQATSYAAYGSGSYDPDALRSWQQFLKTFFHDGSPGEDTDRDTATFNSAYGTDYASWADVPQFKGKELEDKRKGQLAGMWLASSFADYVDGLCGAVRSVKRDAVVGPGVTEPFSASFMVSRKSVATVYTSDVEMLPAIDSAAACFGKSATANGVRLFPGNYEKSKQRVLKLLPYAAGAFFACDGPSQPPDPASRVIPELAPFVGKFRMERPSVLSIVGGRAAGRADAFCVSEAALALNPKLLDLTRYKAIVYDSDGPCISLAIMQELFEYALKGGPVILDGYRIASGPTLHGRDNAHFWWTNMKLARASKGDGETTVAYEGRTWKLPGTLQYLLPDGDKVQTTGKVTDSTGATYPLLITRKIGQEGRWVFVNVPGYDGDLSLLPAIVKGVTGIDLPGTSGPRVYRGDNCVLALGGAEPFDVRLQSESDVAVYDVIRHKAFTAKASGGALVLPGSKQSGLWVVKPFGKPVVLYTDGTMDHAASTADGTFDGKSLKFRFAEKATVSSPEKPKSVKVDGKPAEYTYDAAQRVVMLGRGGNSVEAVLEYGE